MSELKQSKEELMNHSKGISVTDKGIIAILKYESKRLKQAIAILGLTTTCSVIAVIYLVTI